MSVFCSSRCVAKLCRSVCRETGLSISAIIAAAWQARLSWRVVSGCTGSRPGNSQSRGRAAFHQARNRSRRYGDSMTYRSPAFARAGSCGPCIGDTQRRLVLEARGRIQQAGNLPRAQHDWQFPRLADERQPDDDLRLAQRHDEEKPQRGHSVVDGRRAGAARNEMQLIAPQILEAGFIWRGAEESAEALDGADVAFPEFAARICGSSYLRSSPA